ncbi:hypothetical protein ACU4GD_27265 [Cupriavidus basilensis]
MNRPAAFHFNVAWPASMPVTLHGIPVSRGVAIGARAFAGACCA